MKRPTPFKWQRQAMAGLIVLSCFPLLLVVGLRTLAVMSQLVGLVLGATWPWLLAAGVLVVLWRIVRGRR
jgi:hypothetical protein